MKQIEDVINKHAFYLHEWYVMMKDTGYAGRSDEWSNIWYKKI